MEYKRLTIRNSDGSVSQPTSTTIEKVFYQLAEFEDKIESGLMIELPCKIGDELYLVVRDGKDCTIESGSVTQFSVDESGVWVHMRDKYLFSHCIHGKSKGLFLTREEAEAKLKELQNG